MEKRATIRRSEEAEEEEDEEERRRERNGRVTWNDEKDRGTSGGIRLLSPSGNAGSPFGPCFYMGCEWSRGVEHLSECRYEAPLLMR